MGISTRRTMCGSRVHMVGGITRGSDAYVVGEKLQGLRCRVDPWKILRKGGGDSGGGRSIILCEVKGTIGVESAEWVGSWVEKVWCGNRPGNSGGGC